MTSCLLDCDACAGRPMPRPLGEPGTTVLVPGQPPAAPPRAVWTEQGRGPDVTMATARLAFQAPLLLRLHGLWAAACHFGAALGESVLGGRGVAG